MVLPFPLTSVVEPCVIGAGCARDRKKLKSYEGVQKSQDQAKRELKEEFAEISSRNGPMA